MAVAKRPYTHRTNSGGNFCGHRPDAPRLELVKPSTDKTRPKILAELQSRVRQYYRSPRYIPSLNAANGSRRQQRSERREACLLLLNAILEFTDLSSLRCGVPTSAGFISLTLDYLVQYTGMNMRRAERAMADLKRANLLTVSQPRQLQEDGSWRGLAAVKAVNALLFTAFGLHERLRHERDRAAKRLAKKAVKAGGSLTGWSRNKLVLGKPPTRRGSDEPGLPRGVDRDTYARARAELLIALKQAYPDMPPDERNAEAERIIRSKLRA
ncbi:TPA: hypothetical protein SMT25_005598 [Pseudomonas aeruginosa]|uniref:hypothetical protein n=1 Tax=Pseudomonas aeruginosa TaxID=287 RepID=UPI0012901EBA|nr:hypothetical protein [Pseudomonas aeruginosa]MBX6310944.1 hypothetical protein [Pseudomonas aeruginosa]HEK2572444.1 hypothetical protein [Pseudomonas aeruginosa]HEK2591462.1 hypothetical protein [Pseudomonas aeruginosa]HEK3697574.1 hypothetical protein [Pseudomonas aeruginosa]